MSFLQSVRSSKVRQPTQTGFTLEKWELEFKKYTDGSNEDVSLFEAGNWIFENLETIRKKSSSLSFDGRDSSQLIKLYIGFCNFQYVSIMYQVRMTASESDEVVSASETVEKKVKLPYQEADGKVSSLIQGLVSSLRYPIAEAFKVKSHSSRLSEEEHLRTIYKIRDKANLASLYEGYETIVGFHQN